MLDNTTMAIKEYNDILCGVKKRFSKMVHLTEDVVIEIGRYAFTYYMRWSPQQIRDRLNLSVLEKLQLKHLFFKHSSFPHELNPKTDFYYFAHWLYPDIIQYDVKGSVLKIYNDILKGTKSSYTINFFNDEFALFRAQICLQEAIRQNSFKNERELYELFGDYDKGLEFIKRHKLYKPFAAFYHIPIIFLHESLPLANKSEFWYNYYLFRYFYERGIPSSTDDVDGEN